MFTIQAKTRDLSEDLDALRKAGEVPAVYYGMGSSAATSIAISTVEFKKIWAKAGESSAVSVVVNGKPVDALIHEVQRHPITGEPIHVDFLMIDMNKKITVSVPVEFEGVSPAVKSGLGSLVKVLHEIEIEALPKEIPHNLVADISKLVTVDDNIFASDLVLPKGTALVTKDTEVVAAIAVAKEEVEAAPVDLSAIEVEKKGKKEEEADSAK